MNVLVACEESQTVCKAFRARGHEAYSCDIQEPSGGHPEWHILGDAIEALKGGIVTTMDGERHEVGRWDIAICHPPCTDLAVSGAAWFAKKQEGGRQKRAVEFFMKMFESNADRIAVENPVCIMSTYYRKPNQIIQPYQFGHHARKATCLWLTNLPKLVPTNIVSPGEFLAGGYSVGAHADGRDENGKWLRRDDPKLARLRSKTFHGIAEAMAEQWGNADKYPIQMDIFNLLKEGT